MASWNRKKEVVMRCEPNADMTAAPGEGALDIARASCMCPDLATYGFSRRKGIIRERSSRRSTRTIRLGGAEDGMTLHVCAERVVQDAAEYSGNTPITHRGYAG